MWLRSAYEADWQVLEAEFWKTCIHNILFEYTQSEYWFLYGLVGNVLLAPFLSKAFQNAERGELIGFLTVGILFNGVITYLPYANARIEWEYLFGGFTFYFCLGYGLEKVVDEKKEKWVMLAGCLCFLLSMVLKHWGYDRKIHDLAPTYVFVICGMWFFLKRLYALGGKPLDRVWIFVGKHSFSVYMVHVVVMDQLMRRLPFPVTGRYLIDLLLIILLTTGISLGIGTFLDLTAVAFLKYIMKRILFWKKGSPS